MNTKLQYIKVTDPLYNSVKDIRIKCFFEGMPNASELINDDFEETGYHLVCLEGTHKVLGTGRLNIEGAKGIISQMAIHPYCQRMGIGSRILEELLLKCQKLGVDIIELSARETAITFYEKYGFETLGSLYPSKKTGVIHQKMISKTSL